MMTDMFADVYRKVRKAAVLFRKAFGRHYPHIAILLIIGFLNGLLEGVGVNALIPLFSFVEGKEATDFISQTIQRLFAFFGVNFSVSYLLIFIAVIFITKALILFAGTYISLRIVQDYTKNIRSVIVKRVLRAEWPYLIEQKIGVLEKVLSIETKSVAALFGVISSLVIMMTGTIMYLLVALNISVSITLVALCTIAVLFFVFQPFIKKTRRVSHDIIWQGRENAHFINENVIGMKTVKAMSVTEPVARVADERFEKLRQLGIRLTLLNSIPIAFFQPFSVVFVLILFAFSYKTGSFSLPAFAALIYLIQRIFLNMQNFYSHLQGVSTALPYLEHVVAYEESARTHEETNSGWRQFIFEKEFSFNDVSFCYPKGSPVLSGVSFSVPKGSFIGLIGPSGAGKTTLVDIILRLLTPTSGTITLDSVPIAETHLHEFRRNVGYVSQDIHLTNSTVADNIRFYDNAITDEQIIIAAKQAHIFDTIEALPRKFMTVIGERGVHLSVGQRQRIVIARVLARAPKILVLDEATSALDNESEVRIQEVIEGLKEKTTIIAIAHRLGTVLNCDILFVLDRGAITESGKPRDLLADKDSYFFKMHNLRT